MTSFKEKIRKNKIKQPTQFGFGLEDWNKKWNQEINKIELDAELYLAGKIIYEILEEIRSALEDLYRHSPNIRNEELIKIYLALSNRDRAILSKSHEKHIEEVKNIFSATINAGLSGNKLTLQEVADNCVDGVENAIKYCVKRIEEGKALPHSSDPMELMEYVSRESMLSQLYGVHESYWRALLWGEYRFLEKSKGNKIYAIVQDKTNLEVSATYSQIRKQKLEAQLSAISASPQISGFFNDDKYAWIVKKGKRRAISSRQIAHAPDEVVHINSAWRARESFLSDEFPASIIRANSAKGFSVMNALNVFRCLVILSWQQNNQYPEDDSAYSVKKLLQFCPKIKKIDLAKGLEKTTGYTFQETGKILDFLEYRGQKGQDLWCHPILDVGNNEYALLTSSLVTPSLIRVVEHWLVQLELDVSSKGEAYENTVIESLNSAVRDNFYINDFDKGVCQRIKLENGEEEIDLLIRIGNIVLLGEAKSIVTTDSPISQYRTISTLQYAAAQAKRKSSFLIDNMNEIFAALSWKFDSTKSYEVVACVINSGRMFVGSSIDGIPVVDEKVLTAYFSSNRIPLFSRMEKQNGEAEHLSWFVLYGDFNELQRNMRRYLSDPPQIIDDGEGFEHKALAIPSVSENLHKIAYVRLVPKDVRPIEVLKRTHSFPLRSVDNIEKELESMDVFF